MMRTLLLGLLWLASPGGAGAVDYSLVPRVAPKLTKVQAAAGDGRVAIGTGVMVAADTVVTNCHVTRDAKHIEIWSGGQRFVVSGQSANVDRDLCALFTSGMPDLVVPIAPGRPRIGSSVLGVGYSGGLELRFGIGQIRALHDYDGGAVIQTDAVFDSGASGGGLFNDQGELIGFVTFRHRGQTKDVYHFSVPAAWSNPLLEVKRAKDVGVLGSEAAFWQRPLDRQPFFLQAVALQAEARWTELRELALRWTRSEPDNGTAWTALSVASVKLDRPGPGMEAGRRAVLLHPDDPNAWLSFAAACRAAGEAKGVEDARAALARLNPRYLDELDRAQPSP